MHAPESLTGLRVTADPDSLDRAVWPMRSRVLRIAPDDVIALDADRVVIDDPHAIVEPESMYTGTWLELGDARRWVAENAEWLLPERDGLSQGMVAALPVKVLVERNRALVIVPVSLSHELEERL